MLGRTPQTPSGCCGCRPKADPLRDRGRPMMVAIATLVVLLAAVGVAVANQASIALAQTSTAPSDTSGGVVVDLFHRSGGMTLAADDAGSLHAAALLSLDDGATWSAVYAHC